MTKTKSKFWNFFPVTAVLRGKSLLRQMAFVIGFSGAVFTSTPASALTIFGNSATFGPDLVHEFNISGGSGTLVQNFNVSTGNGRGVVVVGNTIYSTESGPSGNPFGGSNKIYMTDRTTGLSLGSITVSGLPTGAAMSTLAWDGTHFWTSEYLGGNHAYRIDTSGTIVKTITLGLASTNMDGMEYFNGKLISNRFDGGIGGLNTYDIYDLDGNVLQANFIQAINSTGIAFDGTDFFVSNIFNNTLSQWNGTTGAFIGNVSLLGNFQVEDLSIDYSLRPDTGGTPVPEPSTIILLSLGLASVVGIKMKFRT